MSYPMDPSFNGNLKKTGKDRLIFSKDECKTDWTIVGCLRHKNGASGVGGGFTQGTRYRRSFDRVVRRATRYAARVRRTVLRGSEALLLMHA